MTIEVLVLRVLSIDLFDCKYAIIKDAPSCLLCLKERREAGRAHLSLIFSVDSRYENALREVLGERGQLERRGSALRVWVRSCTRHSPSLDHIYNCAKTEHVVHIIDLRENTFDCKAILLSVD